MDPNVYHLEHGLPGEPGQGDDGASYLRRLKIETSQDGSPEAAVQVSPVPAERSAPAMKERRRSRRFACSGSIEIIAEGSSIPMRGTLSDISLHGCYTEMSTTLPVNTVATLTVDALGFRFRTLAKVRASYPFLGMGMSFLEIATENQSQLELILAALSGQSAAPTLIPSEAPSRASMPIDSVDARACLDQIVELYQQKDSLSREEFYEIAKRACRS